MELTENEIIILKLGLNMIRPLKNYLNINYNDNNKFVNDIDNLYRKLEFELDRR